MRRYFRVVCTLLLISCTPAKNQQFTSKEGGFRVVFPQSPEQTTTDLSYDFGKVTEHTFMTKTDKDGFSYSVSYADYPVQLVSSDSVRLLQEFFNFTQQDLFKKLGPTAVSSLSIKMVNQYPGREYRWESKAEHKGYTTRAFLVNSRGYKLCAAYRLEKDFNDEIEHFLNTFALIDNKQNPNPEKIPSRPTRDFEINFPGKVLTTDNPRYDAVLGNIYAVTESFEVPDDEKELPQTDNILYGINYATLPDDKINSDSLELTKKFLESSVTDNAVNNQGKVLMMNEISLNGFPGIEAMSTFHGDMAVMHIKSYIVHNKYYQIMVISKYGKQGNKKAEEFIKSFRLK